MCGKGVSLGALYSSKHQCPASVSDVPTLIPTTDSFPNPEYGSKELDYTFSSVWKGFHD
jgi:hypothetical protein